MYLYINNVIMMKELGSVTVMPLTRNILLKDAILWAMWHVAPESTIQWEGEYVNWLCAVKTVPDSTGLIGALLSVEVWVDWAMWEANNARSCWYCFRGTVTEFSGAADSWTTTWLAVCWEICLFLGLYLGGYPWILKHLSIVWLGMPQCEQIGRSFFCPLPF